MFMYICQVGVLEEMNKTLAVFEAFMPRHFRGARQAYWSYASEVNRWVFCKCIGHSLEHYLKIFRIKNRFNRYWKNYPGTA